MSAAANSPPSDGARESLPAAARTVEHEAALFGANPLLLAAR